MRWMEQITPGGSFSGKGGQWVPDTDPEKNRFRGTVMPVKSKELQHGPQGTSAKYTLVLYTNGHALEVGAQFTDIDTGMSYTIAEDLNHGTVHPMRKYAVETRGRASSK